MRILGVLLVLLVTAVACARCPFDCRPTSGNACAYASPSARAERRGRDTQATPSPSLYEAGRQGAQEGVARVRRGRYVAAEGSRHD